MFKDWTGDDIEESIPDPQIQSDTQDHLARGANRLRQSTQPRDPLDLEFDLNHDYVPDGFLKADIQKRGKHQGASGRNRAVSLGGSIKNVYRRKVH